MEKIISKSNPKIKYAAKLVSESSFRKKEALFCVEGLRICLDAVESDVEIFQTFFTENSMKKHPEELEKILRFSKEAYEVSEDVFSKISDTGSPQGVLSVCKNSKNIFTKSSIEPLKKYIVLENVQDPSNLGAICRTAEALGIDGAVLVKCCDIYNPKVLRGSMGSLFRLPIIKTDSIEEFAEVARKNNIKIFTTVTDRDAKKITDFSFDSGVACIIGNEGNGVSEKAKEICDSMITIPMLGRAQSLNASQAACITMWEMLR